MRRIIARMLVGLIVFTGLLPVTPHDDFGTAAHAHGVIAYDSGGVTSPDDGSRDQDGHVVVHCNGSAHLFVTVAPIPGASSCHAERVDPLAVKLPASLVTGPAPPPPNA